MDILTTINKYKGRGRNTMVKYKDGQDSNNQNWSQQQNPDTNSNLANIQNNLNQQHADETGDWKDKQDTNNK
jgi:hypothetical protein